MVPYAAVLRLARKTPSLSQYPPASDGPHVSVIIPARNEAETIATSVTSILASQYSNIELIVVDDRSTDDTATIVESLQRDDTRLHLVRGSPLPPDWYGKPWACVQGAREARGEVLLFTDADTVHSPLLIAHAVTALSATGAGLLTVSPRQLCVSFWERLVMPQIWLLLGTRYHPRVVNRAKRSRDVIANGQFVMTPRSTYEMIGTHEAVKGEVAEDLALAQRYHRRGERVWFAFAERLMATRMYRDLPHIIEGWSKNIYLGGRLSFPDEPLLRAFVPLGLSLALLFWLVPPIVLLLAPVFPTVHVAMMIAAALSALFWMAMSIAMRIPFWYGLLYPLGAAMALFIVWRSTWRGSAKVEWKGRVYGGGGGKASSR